MQLANSPAIQLTKNDAFRRWMNKKLMEKNDNEELELAPIFRLGLGEGEEGLI